jgi:hypothetical protein
MAVEKMESGALLFALLVLLCADAARAQTATTSCDSEAELLDSLNWVREACSEEGEHFPDEVDALVPTAVTTRGCAEVVRRVAANCDGLLVRSPTWFGSRGAALAAAAAAAVALEDTGGLVGSAQTTFLLADSSLPTIRTCGAVLVDGFDEFPTIGSGQSFATINVGASHGNLVLEFEELTLDQNANDNLRLYADEDRNEELRAIFHDDLPLTEPIEIPGSAVYVMLVSDGVNRRTSLRATVSCVCDTGSWQDSAKAPPTCGPCATCPCRNGGTCHVSTGAADGVGGGHRRAQGSALACDLEARTAAVNAACCDGPAADCAGGGPQSCDTGGPQSCDTGCAQVLLPFWEDCATALRGSTAVDEVLQAAARLCQEHVAEYWWLGDGNMGHMRAYADDYDCVCRDGWTGQLCENRDLCFGVDCGEHGACVDGLCVCSSGWSGPTCSATPFPGSQLIAPEDGTTINSWISDGPACGGTHPFAEQYFSLGDGDCEPGWQCGAWFCYTHPGNGATGGAGACVYTGSAPTPTPGGSWGTGTTPDRPSCSYESLSSGGDPHQVWERCFSSFEHDSSTPVVFHQQCDPYDVTVTVVRNSLDEGHTFGGYSVGSWNRDRCCQADSNDCESDGHCWDHSAVDDFLFGLGPALGRFDVSGSTDTVPYGYQFVSPGWPCWGGSGGIGDL